jgi:hypothetical protein
MSCIASIIREINIGFFAPDFEFERNPKLLVGEPALADQHTLRDGRTWVRVYLDGSALDDRGTVRLHAAFAAELLRCGDHALPLAA